MGQGLQRRGSAEPGESRYAEKLNALWPYIHDGCFAHAALVSRAVVFMDPAFGARAREDARTGIYRDMLDVCVAASACNGFTIWGFTDRYSWVPSTFSGFGSALIFDEEYQPKLAYYVLRDGLE